MKSSIQFVTFTFLITWGAWFSVIFFTDGSLEPGSPAFLMYGLGGLLGPVVAAFVTKRFDREFLRQLGKVRVGFAWYITILVIPFILGILPFGIEALVGDGFGFAFETPYYMVALMLPMMILGGGLEEVGWRGVLLPELLKRYTVLTSTLIVALVWAVWHLPLWFIEGTVQYGSNIGWFFISILGTSFILSVVYVKTQSVLLCILLHALFNANSAYFQGDLSSWNEGASVTFKLLLCFIFFFLLIKEKPVTVASGGRVIERH